MPGIYTAPSMSFIDSYVNAARHRDQRSDEDARKFMEGFGNLARGGVEAYKWQVRKNIADEAEQLARREEEIMAELERLRSEGSAAASSNMEAITRSTGWKGVPYPYPGDEGFEAPRMGLGVFRKELL